MAKTDFEYFIVGMSVEEGRGEGYFRKINFEHDTHRNFISTVCLLFYFDRLFIIKYIKRKKTIIVVSASGLEPARFEKLRNNSDETRCIRHSIRRKRIERGSIVSRKLRR